jgi:Mycobacterium membrane protein
MKHLSGPSILFAVCIGFAATCGVANATGDLPQVRYEVTGSSPVAEYISYQTDTGQQHATNVSLPWSTQFTAFGGQVFVLSAQGQGSISCRILIDGNSVNDAKSAGTPGRAVCSH